MYHCGTAPVLMHIGSGMYGAIIVSPREPLPPAKEFVLVQSEFYLADAANGVRAFDYQKMLTTHARRRGLQRTARSSTSRIRSA